MPLYEYECEACGQRFELIRKYSDPPVDVCALCGKGPVSRLFSSPAIQFKGSGWYITDYAQKGKGEKTEASSDGSKTADAKADAGSGSEKPSTTPTDGGGKKDSSAPSSDKSQGTSHKAQGSSQKDS